MATPKYPEHSDDIATKLRLLEAAYSAGKLDIAMSLTESIKDTLRFENQTKPKDRPAALDATAPSAVKDLAPPVARWLNGWAHYKPVTLFETVGIARTREPVELAIRFPASETVDLGREIRVIASDPVSKIIREIPSQVFGESQQGKERHCRLLFLADVPAHQSAQYLIAFGNPNAQRPRYVTDLAVHGEGYALDIGNQHYQAELSRQTGQIHRLVYRREHGLELYAGGKGHGEPPDIDWGHDYVDKGQFQKLRIRNWAHCPNYEVIRGPLCVQVRRWGFPHSPMHPLFTPSRMHMDVTYTFYAGLPYFLKQSRFDMVQDFPIEAMRDDEWVFSGYSFTDSIWLDATGRLHEGTVPPEHSNSLWGVGFYHKTSRDAFVALRLEHQSKGMNEPQHGGVPTLHYAGHGQLWSRYPAEKTTMTAGSSLSQKNAYLVSPFPDTEAAKHYEQTRHRLLHPLEVQDTMPPELTGLTIPAAPLARAGETPETARLKPAIWKMLREVRDEQFYTIDANVVDMGYVYDVEEQSGIVRILLTMPHRGRPVYEFFVSQGGGRVEEGIRERLLKLPGVREVVVDFTWEPPWTVSRLTDDGRKSLGLTT